MVINKLRKKIQECLMAKQKMDEKIIELELILDLFSRGINITKAKKMSKIIIYDMKHNPTIHKTQKISFRNYINKYFKDKCHMEIT